MNTLNNWSYYLSRNKKNYIIAEKDRRFADGMAEAVKTGLNPETALYIGNEPAFPVYAMRMVGIKAYGLGIKAEKKQAISADGSSYVYGYSFTDDTLPSALPANFDLLICAGAMEQLAEENTAAAVKKLGAMSGKILLFPFGDEEKDASCLNDRPREYWAKLFAAEGFIRSLKFGAQYIMPDAMYFEKNKNADSKHIIEVYEHYCRLMEAYLSQPHYYSLLEFCDVNGSLISSFGKSGFDKNYSLLAEVPKGTKLLRLTPAQGERCVIQDLRFRYKGNMLPVVFDETPLRDICVLEQGANVSAALKAPAGEGAMVEIKARIFTSKDDLAAQLMENYGKTLSELEKLTRDYGFLHEKALHHQGDTNEKIIWLREKVAELEETLTKDHEIFAFELKALQNEKQQILSSFSWKLTKPLRLFIQGTKKLLRRVPGYKWLTAVHNLGRKQVAFNKKHYGTLETPRSGLIPSWQILAAQERVDFSPAYLFSIVVPLYNTPEKYLRDMIQSVIGQTYPHWELCLADGSDFNHANVGEIAAKYAAKDKRIKYKKLESNKGISLNSNEAIDMARGEYISLLDHDDILFPNALFEVYKAAVQKNGDFIYSDEATFLEDDISHITVPHFKPGYAPDNLRANNYICHFTSFKRSLLEKSGGAFRQEYDGSQDFDLVLRLTEQAEHIVHIPQILYLWRSHSQSVAEGFSAKPHVVNAAINAINAHLERVGLKGHAEPAPAAERMYRLCYELESKPLVSIIIPNKDEADTLEVCINSIVGKSTYSNYEIIICENNSEENDTFNYYEKIQQNPKIKLIKWDSAFNYSAINNYAAKQADGEYLLFLNNDTEVISPGWIEEMLMYAQRSDVGAVGAKLYYPDDTLQHGGLVFGMRGVAGHAQRGLPKGAHGYMGNLTYARNVTAVTGACLMVSKSIFQQLKGFDEGFRVAFNDVDLCIRIWTAGYLNVITPFAELYHYESKSRGLDTMPEHQKRFSDEVVNFKTKWAKELRDGDPYFNPNFSLNSFGYVYDLSKPCVGSDEL